MTWKPQKNDVLDALAAEFLHNYSKGRAIVGIDGVDAAGKSHFAADFAAALERAGHTAIVASIDGFHRPRAERYARGKDSPQGFFEDSYDYEAFRSKLIAPFRAREPFVTAVFDHRTDAPVDLEPVSAPDDAILVVDGIFLHRPELRGIWNFSVWLDVPLDVAEQRLRQRDGDSGVGDRYSGGQAIYLKQKPRARATAIVDNADFEHPRRVFADAC